MKTQTYYNTETERAANICDLSKELLINCAGAVSRSYGIRNAYVRNDYYLMYLIKGKMNIELGGNKNVISAGQFLIIKAGTKYFYQSDEGEALCYLWLHFTGSRAEALLKEYSIETNRLEYAGIRGELLSLWKRMFREFIINDKYFEKASSALLNEILTELSRGVNRIDKKESILKSVVYIHENYSKELSVSMLAEMEELSESYYRYCFKNVTGVTPMQYIIDRRMDAAASMLEKSGMKLNEISEAVGYTDAYYFSRLFKKKFGISPGKYRKQ